MNPILRPLLASFCLIAGAALAAQEATTLPRSDIPPPPGLDDPGVESRPATAAEAPAPPVAGADSDPLAPLPPPDARLVRDKASRDAAADARRVAASDVTRRTEGSDTVEEYRQNGHLWMIRIVPQNGPTQTFVDPDGSGRLQRDPREGPVSPVYYTLYEWR